MNSINKSLLSVLLVALLCAGVAAVGWGRYAIINVMQDAVAPAQLALNTTSAHLNASAPRSSSYSGSELAQSANEPFQIDVTLVGNVALAWGAQGTFSNTWAAGAVNTLAEEAPFDIAFLLGKGEGNAVTAYVELENSLVFSATGSISTTIPGDTSGNDSAPAVVTQAVGPRATGVLAGNQLTLLSERITYTTESGQTVQRQFRLTASPDNASDALMGEYRETVWGLTFEPLTVGGPFTLHKPAVAPTDTNQAPVANAQTVTTGANMAKAITLTGSDADSNALTYVIVTTPTRGTLSGTPPNMTYTPRTDFVGSDSFTFKVNDGQVDSDAAAVSITVTGEGSSNRTPLAQNDTATTSAGKSVTINVLANDSDPDGDALTVTILQQPQHGSAEVNGTTIIYTPNGGYTGPDTLAYTVTDSKGATANATVTITVQAAVDGATIYLPVIHK